MKPRTTHTNPPVQAFRPAITTIGNKTLMFMKTRLTLFILALCGAFAGTSAFGADGTWTGAGDGTNLAVAANWTPGLPGTAGADVAWWSGYTNGNPATNLVLHYNNNGWASGFQSSGVNLYVTSNQVGSVTIMSDVAGFSSPIAIWNITNDFGAGAFTFGGTDANHIINWIGRPQATPFHTLMNNSTNTATLTPWIQYTAGGAVTWTLDFQGVGNWQVNSHIVNNNGAGMILQVDGPGTVFWNPQGYLGANGLNSPIVINAGTLVLQAHSPKLGNQAFTLTGTFDFDAPNDAQTLSGVISGAGNVKVANGTLTLSGANIYNGYTVLTNNGELILNRAEIEGTSGPLGVGGTITFGGGVLGFSPVNTFDYSLRFDLSTNQQYKFDTRGQSVTLSTIDLASAGGSLTKIGPGTLTIATPTLTYTGPTTVSGGKLVFQTAKSGTGDITVADGAALDVYNNGTLTTGTLTLGSSSGASLEFDGVNSTSTPMLTANTVAASGTTTINVNSGTFTVGQSYPLLTWTTGTAPGVSLGVLNGFVGNLSTNGNKIQLNITATALLWTGLGGATWDFSAVSWKQNGASTPYTDSQPTLFDDTASQFSVTVNSLVQPKSITVNNTILSGAPYTITSSGANRIGGSTSLTKSGDNVLTLAGGANTYTGITTVNNGTLSVSAMANGGSASDIGAASSDPTNLVINGGKLLYTGGAATVDRLFSVGTGGATIDAEGTNVLNLSNPGTLGVPGVGAHGLTLTGVSTNILAGILADSGSGLTALTKSGTGLWILTGTNSYSGGTTVSSGQLQVGNGGNAGTLGNGNVVNSSQIHFNRTGTVTVPGNISGSGSVANDGSGTLNLTGANTYSGGTTINAGTVQLSGAGTMNPNAGIVNNGTFIMSSSTPLNISGFQTGISGSGNVIVGANSTLSVIDWSVFTGWLLINSGGSYQPTYGNEGTYFGASVITNNGTLLFLRQDNNVFGYSNNIVGSGKVVKENNNQNSGDITLAGTNNTYSGGTWIRGGGIILGGLFYNVTNVTDTTTNVVQVYVPGSGSIAGPVIFTNTGSAFNGNDRYLTFNRNNETFTFANNIVSSVTDGSAVGNQGRVIQQGTNSVVILTGNNSYPGTTTINANSTLQVGNGGSSGTIGSGGIVNNGTLIFDRSGTLSNTNAISGTGLLLQKGSGTVVLTSTNNTYTGDTVISNGTLGLAKAPGNLNLEGGYLSPGGPIGTIGTLNVSNLMNLDAGTLVVTINKSSSSGATNSSVYQPGGLIFFNGAKLKLVNYGPALVPGDTFTIFNLGVFGGDTVPIVSPGVTFVNNLLNDGSVTVATVASTPPHLTNSISGNQLVLSWDSAWAGSHLQVQTNTTAKGLGTNWVTVDGTDTALGYTNTISKFNVAGTTNGANNAVFYRLINQ